MRVNNSSIFGKQVNNAIVNFLAKGNVQDFYVNSRALLIQKVFVDQQVLHQLFFVLRIEMTCILVWNAKWPFNPVFFVSMTIISIQINTKHFNSRLVISLRINSINSRNPFGSRLQTPLYFSRNSKRYVMRTCRR